MNWDEKAQSAAVADRHALYEEDEDGFEFCGFGNESDAQDHGFTAGARWQREALLSDEAVERAARGIHASHDRGCQFEAEDHAVQDEYLDMARAALAAAIEGDE